MLNFYSYFCQFLSITFVVYWHSLSLFLPIVKVVWLESCLLIWISNPDFSKYSKPGPETESSYLRWIKDVTQDEKIGLKRFSKCQCVFSFSISALLSVLTMMTPIPMPTPPMMCSLVLNISSIAAGQLWQSRWRETGMCQQLEGTGIPFSQWNDSTGCLDVTLCPVYVSQKPRLLPWWWGPPVPPSWGRCLWRHRSRFPWGRSSPAVKRKQEHRDF